MTGGVLTVGGRTPLRLFMAPRRGRRKFALGFRLVGLALLVHQFDLRGRGFIIITIAVVRDRVRIAGISCGTMHPVATCMNAVQRTTAVPFKSVVHVIAQCGRATAAGGGDGHHKRPLVVGGAANAVVPCFVARDACSACKSS